MENKIMDKLTVNTKKVKVLSVHLENANQQLDALNSDNVVIKSCVANVNLFSKSSEHSLFVTNGLGSPTSRWQTQASIHYAQSYRGCFGSWHFSETRGRI